MIDSLKDLEITEKDEVDLRLSLSKQRAVIWTKDGCLIAAEDRIMITDEGLTHCLKISNATLEDCGAYSAEIDDNNYGKTKSTCRLRVKGFFLLLL